MNRVTITFAATVPNPSRLNRFISEVEDMFLDFEGEFNLEEIEYEVDIE